jgi:two-component system response regulator HydG
VSKPVELELLTTAVTRALEHHRLRDRVRTLSMEVEQVRGSSELMGDSRAMRELRSQIGRLAQTDATVLIRGESGTGKELVARSLHAQSPRRSGALVAVNCAAVPEALLESELFGHVAGAFTGATRARKGLFLAAHGGTLFLDEVGDLPLDLQPKLLRAVESRKIRPVGGDREIDVDVRLLTATHRDLESALRDGQFREDLYYRLNVVELEVPPLRARGGDVLVLAQSFLLRYATRFEKSVSTLTESAAERLLAYDWPGNVRELQNAMERAVALARHDQIVVDDLPERIRQYRRTGLSFDGDGQDQLVPLAEVERRYIAHVLDAVGGNKTLAAKILGCDRKTLYRKLEG